MKRLLLADADHNHAQALEIAIQGEGYRVIRVHSPEEWDQVTDKKSFDLILMDESLHSISRYLFSLSKEAYKTFEKTPVIIMTEYPELAEFRHKFPQKARFLLKPFQAEEMFGLIRQIFFEETVVGV